MILLISIIVFLLIQISIGIYSVKKVRNATDFILASRSQPTHLVLFSLFATWFGAETILSSSVLFAEGGFIAVIKEPFGASLCLFLTALFFVRPLYRMGLGTLCDFFGIRYGKKAETLSALILSVSYFSWIAAQYVAMGNILQVVLIESHMQADITFTIIAAAVIVIFYTVLGGMWSNILTDFIQSIFIISGLILFVVFLIPQVASFDIYIQKSAPDFFSFIPDHNTHSILGYTESWMIVGLGSIPSPDIFQRTMSAKNEKVAYHSTLYAAFLFLIIALLPLFIGWIGNFIYPEILPQIKSQKELFMPTLFLKAPLFLQIILFGALFSAVMSTTSAAILAPASVLSENLLKPLFSKLSDKKHLILLRASILIVSMLSLWLSLGNQSVYELASNASSMSLVSIFIPLCFGIYYPRTSAKGILTSMTGGLIVWIILLYIGFEESYIPLFGGLGSSLIGVLLFQKKN